MKETPLHNLCHIIMGQAPKGSSYNDKGEGIPLIAGAGDFGELYPEPNKSTVEPTQICNKGDIIICIRATIGNTNWADKQYCLGRGVAGLQPLTERLNSKYLWYFLKKAKPLLNRQAKGSTFRQISRDTVEGLKIPFAEMSEQISIANTLEKADSLRQKRKESIKLLDDFLRSTFLKMFGDPAANDKNWKLCKVIDVADCIVPGRDKPKSFTGNIPWITTDDLKPLGWTSKSQKGLYLTMSEIDEVRAKIISKNTVIMTCVGDLGVISIAKNEFVMNQQLHAFVCSSQVRNIFLMYNLYFQKAYMLKMASSTTVPYMNKSICNSIPIFLPPVKIQNIFASIVGKVESIKHKMHESLEEIDNNFNALMQRYFG